MHQHNLWLSILILTLFCYVAFCLLYGITPHKLSTGLAARDGIVLPHGNVGRGRPARTTTGPQVYIYHLLYHHHILKPSVKLLPQVILFAFLHRYVEIHGSPRPDKKQIDMLAYMDRIYLYHQAWAVLTQPDKDGKIEIAEGNFPTEKQFYTQLRLHFQHLHFPSSAGDQLGRCRICASAAQAKRDINLM